jgi:glucosylceramidase
MHFKILFLVLSACSVGRASAQKAAKPALKATAPAAYSAAGKKAQAYITAQGTAQRLAAGPALAFQPAGQPLETQVCVFVDPNHTFQTMLGIGGALTDAAAETFAKLPKAQQQEFLQAYYSPTAGIGYTLARTTVHSSDFSSGSYTYVAGERPSAQDLQRKARRAVSHPSHQAGHGRGRGQAHFVREPVEPAGLDEGQR